MLQEMAIGSGIAEPVEDERKRDDVAKERVRRVVKREKGTRSDLLL